MTATRPLVHLAILVELEAQLATYQHQDHLWRMRAMGIIDSLTSLFVRMPVDEEDRGGVLELLRRLERNSKLSLAVGELRYHERRSEVNDGRSWNPIHDMIRHCGGDPYGLT